MDIESCVVEKAFWFDPSFSRLDHDSLVVVGHSLRKGRMECCSCFNAPGESISLPKKQCCCRCFGIVESIVSSETPPKNCGSFLVLNMGLEGTWVGNRHHVLSVLEPIPRLLTPAEVS